MSLPDRQLGIEHVFLLHIGLLVGSCPSRLTVDSDIALQLHAYRPHKCSVKGDCS